MRSTLIGVLILATCSGFTKSSSGDGILFKKIGKRLTGDWSYQYSMNNEDKFIISNEEFIHGRTHVFFRINFLEFSKSYAQWFDKNNPALNDIRRNNVLNRIEMFGDYVGCPEYPVLENEAVNQAGELIECKITTYWNCDNSGYVQSKTFNIERLTKDTLIISGYSGYLKETKEIKHIYSRSKN